MGSTPLGYCWFIYKIGARTGRLTGQFETYALMFSLCLSAAGVRFLQPPVPAEELALPRGRVTDPKVRPQRGYPVPHP